MEIDKRLAQSDTEYEDYDEVDEDEEEENTEIVTSYACEDCDYRWEVTFENEEEEALDEVQYCPMWQQQYNANLNAVKVFFSRYYIDCLSYNPVIEY